MSAASRQEWVVCFCAPGESHPEAQFLQSYDDSARPQGPLWRSDRDVAAGDLACLPEQGAHLVVRTWMPSLGAEVESGAHETRTERDTHYHVLMSDGTRSTGAPTMQEALDHVARTAAAARGVARLWLDLLAESGYDIRAERVRAEVEPQPEAVAIIRCDVTSTITEIRPSLLGERVEAGDVR